MLYVPFLAEIMFYKIAIRGPQMFLRGGGGQWSMVKDQILTTTKKLDPSIKAGNDIYSIVSWATAWATALYCTVLHCTVLYCTVLHCTALYCTVLYLFIP